MLVDNYLQELEFASKGDVGKVYGRTKGKKARKKLIKSVKKANKKITKVGRIQNKIDRSLKYSKQHIAPELKQKQLNKAAKLHTKQARLTKQAEKTYKKTIGKKHAAKVLSKRPQIGRVASLKKWGKLGVAVGAVAGAAYVGNKTYKRIKDRRNEGMSISINELRDEIIYEIVHKEDINEGGILRVASKLVRSGKGATSAAGVASKAAKTGKLSKYGKAMGPLGIAFDIMFIFELGGMAYRRFFSKASKACKGSPDRKTCYRRYKVGAKEVQVKTLKSKIGMCSKHKTPDKCKTRVMNKINNLQSDIKFLRQEL